MRYGDSLSSLSLTSSYSGGVPLFSLARLFMRDEGCSKFFITSPVYFSAVIR